MIVQNILLSNESHTHANWLYRDVTVGFSRLYFILDGEAYYEERGKKVRFKRQHLYLTPVRKPFTLSENPNDKLLHTYAHVVTLPAVDRFIEIPVREGTPLWDAVLLWRRYVQSGDHALQKSIVQLLLSLIQLQNEESSTLAARIKQALDTAPLRAFHMQSLSRSLGYTREHLTRCFLDAYGTTPRQYLTACRMELALQLLLDGARSQAVSEQLGYSTPYAFSRAFKSYYGLSPEKYLQTLQPHAVKKPNKACNPPSDML